MREILFRAKAVNRKEGHEYRTDYKNGDWVYGLLANNNPYLDFAEMTNTDGISGIDVDKNTIGQYTGLTDKNGKKIFEGDIIKTNKFSEPNKQYIVKFDFQFGAFIGQDKYNIYFATFDGDSDQFEIIGNIHDNPELIGGDDNV